MGNKGLVSLFLVVLILLSMSCASTKVSQFAGENNGTIFQQNTNLEGWVKGQLIKITHISKNHAIVEIREDSSQISIITITTTKYIWAFTDDKLNKLVLGQKYYFRFIQGRLGETVLIDAVPE